MVQVTKDLDYKITDPQLAAEVEAYANGPRHDTRSSETLDTLARLREDNIEATKTHFHFDNEDELKRERFGKVLQDKEFLRRLQGIIPARYVGINPRTRLLKLEVMPPSTSGGEFVYVCGVQAGYMPEYSTLYFNKYGAPTSEMYRGWRTVLLRLIIAGAITEDQANKVFGTAEGPEARRYRETLYNVRNRR